MLSLCFGIFLCLLGTAGPFMFGPALGLSVYALFVHITPMQLGINDLRAPLIVAPAAAVSYLFDRTYPRKFTFFPVELLLFLFMLLGMFWGAFNARNSSLALEYTFTYLKYAVSLVLLVNILDTDKKVSLFTNSLILSAAWLVYKCWDLRRATAGRFENTGGGVIDDSNQFAAALILLLPLVLLQAFRKGNAFIRTGAALGTFGMVMAVIISASRGAFLGLFALTLAFFVFFKQYRLRITVFSMLFGLSVLPFITTDYLSRMSSISPTAGGYRDASANNRLIYWNRAFSVWKEFPIYGCGLHNFVYYNIAEGSLDEQGQVAHSIWLEALAEGGILVFVPLILILALFFRRTSAVKKRLAISSFAYSNIVALQVGMLGFLVCATFLNRLIYEPIYWWCCLACIYDRWLYPSAIGAVAVTK